MNQDILRTCKRYIDANDMESLHTYYRELMNTEFPDDPDWAWIFQKTYLHACLKQRVEIAKWLCDSLYPMLDPIQKIAIRQTFPYGRYLLAKGFRK